jgi:hypothetical protein
MAGADARTRGPSLRRYHVLQRRHEVMNFYLDGMPRFQIAQRVGASVDVIEADLLWIRNAWLAATLRRFDELKARELASIDRIEREAWAAWRQSRQPQQTTQTEATEGGDLVVQGEVHPAASRRKALVKRVTQSGDAAYLQIALNCSKARREMFGLDEPTRYQIQWEHLSDEQIDRLANGEPISQVIDVQAHALPTGTGSLAADQAPAAQETDASATPH